jgi:hypothetical protein
VREHSSFDYAIVRVVPRVDREEFVNAGVILFCLGRDFLAARVELDAGRVRALAPDADLAAIEEHLLAIPRVCAGGPGSGPIGALSRRERFHWLVSPRSTVVQVSPVHAGLCDDPATELQHLFERMVRVAGS